jgi:hypothetical protein
MDLRCLDVFRCLVNALTDPLDPVRLEAVRTIEQMNGDSLAAASPEGPDWRP